MDWQDILNNAVQAKRSEEMKTSVQLTLGELILLLEAVQDKSKPVVFDEQYHPSGLSNWRGSYSELALEYEEMGEPLAVALQLKLLKDAVGATFYGYKGGEYVMGKTTPVWVANYGESHGFLQDTQAVVGISQYDHHVTVETQLMEY